jgi:hypothetical protein
MERCWAVNSTRWAFPRDLFDPWLMISVFHWWTGSIYSDWTPSFLCPPTEDLSCLLLTADCASSHSSAHLSRCKITSGYRVRTERVLCRREQMERVSARAHGVCNGSCELGVRGASNYENHVGEKTSRWESSGNCLGNVLKIWLESKDGKKCFDPPPHSKEMQKLNKAFGSVHGASLLLNMAALIATIWYGVTLADRLH